MNIERHILKWAAWVTAAGFAAGVWAASPAPLPDEVTNDQMVQLIEQGDLGHVAWVIDSRPAGKYISGHIPGALSLPLDVLKKDWAAAEKLAIPKDGKTVFYCAGRECTLSPDSAKIFKDHGYTNAWVFRNGVPGWSQKQQPLQAEPAFLKKGNVIVLDTAVGQPTLVAAGNQTVQLSLADLQGERGKAILAELSRNAPLVVLERAKDRSATNNTLDALRDLDFRRIAFMPLQAWTEPLAQAPQLSGPLHWAPVYAMGQVSPQDFEAAVKSGQYILDVRPAADHARGHYAQSVSLPIEDMERDFARVPKDVTVYVHCATGAKSQKTYDILGRKGYTNVRYLDAEVNCKGATCTIKE
ncbi:MAG: hypothetical protein Fur007_03660 [Rhodoferax sp.]